MFRNLLFMELFRTHFVLDIRISCSPILGLGVILDLGIQQQVLWQFIIGCHPFELNYFLIFLSENLLHLHHFADELDLLSDCVSPQWNVYYMEVVQNLLAGDILDFMDIPDLTRLISSSACKSLSSFSRSTPPPNSSPALIK